MNLASFFGGVTAMAFAASGIFFLKFWKASSDRFFLFFALACWLISCERVLMPFVGGTQDAIWNPRVESSSWVYLFRLLAFLLILFAFIKKNTAAKSLLGTRRRP